MKKSLLLVLFLALTAILLVSCNTPTVSGTTVSTASPTVSVSEDGYLVVNGVKTEHKLDERNQISINDNSFLVIDGITTNIKASPSDTFAIKDGFLTVNGLKTEYRVTNQLHIWKTTTTAPTCTQGGYDTSVCLLCQKTVKHNETSPLPHTFATTYTANNHSHWFKCENCYTTSDKARHTPNSDGVCTACDIPTIVTDGIIYSISGDNTYATVIGYEGTATKVKIANTYKGVPVKAIDSQAFYLSQIVTLVIPDNVESIGKEAFNACRSLTSVFCGNGLKSIADYAFLNCISLASLTFGDNVTSVGYHAFDGCSSLTFASHSNCKYLGSENNPYLVLVEPSNSRFDAYDIHTQTKVIADYAFNDSERLTAIKIPDSVTNIGYKAFASCPVLKSVVIGDGVKSIGQSAFEECVALNNLVIGESVEIIGADAFYHCYRLTSLIIPDSVTIIERRAFQRCFGLSCVVIGRSVERIDACAFADCVSISDATFKNTSGWWCATTKNATSGTNIAKEDLANPATAASYLKDTHYLQYWFCN